ncbi:alpha/beta fold hydrolase [Agrococcus sp. HG114]|uniref:alpha/beta fold hydrolase n=1 Tax=Agrococcus sp. HG114 TaxID=2969757 RepID=UPI00215A8E4A|nr:alpha/beta hydrolase [Agrococcus sp. HG114]MCR8670961.1 alpha/beta hydrolase [Agrococcus sp. HG114]
MTVFAMAPDGVRIAIHELGDPEGRPVLMIHGFSSNARRNWIDSSWGGSLAERGLRGIAMDLRGHGESDRPSTGYDVPRFLDDVDAVLEQLALDEPPGAIGYSMGARLLWRHAGTRPHAFRALVLGGLPAGDPFERFDLDLARRALEGRAAPGPMEAFIVDLAGVFPEHDPATLVTLAGEVSRTLFDPAQAPPPVPTLLMTGDRDDRASDTRELVALLPDGRFEEIPGRNHVNAPTSGAFRRTASAFLAEHLG